MTFAMSLSQLVGRIAWVSLHQWMFQAHWGWCLQQVDVHRKRSKTNQRQLRILYSRASRRGGERFQMGVFPIRTRPSRFVLDIPCPSSPFFWKRRGKPPNKQGFFISTPNPKSLKGKTLKEKESSQGRQQGIPKKTSEGRHPEGSGMQSGLFLCSSQARSF